MEPVLYICVFAAGVVSAWFFLNRNKPGSGSQETPLSIPEHVQETEEENFSENNEELQQVKHELSNLYLVNELSQKITSSLSLNDSFRQLYNVVNSMMDAAVVELDVRYGDGEEDLYFSNLKNVVGSDLPRNYNHMSEWCFENGRSIFLSNAEDDFSRYVSKQLVLPGNQVAKSVMCLPIHGNNRVIGTLTVISFNKDAFEPFHQEMINHLIPFIAVSIKNAHHHRELDLLKQRAERSEQFMQQFLANMSHEIRTPIHAITGMTQLLLDKNPTGEQTGYLESIGNASETLLVIINDILDVSKIEANKLEIEQINFSVREVVKNVYDMLRLKAEGKHLVFNCNVDPSVAPVLIGDPVRLTQILLNLVGNAVKFTDKGSITVSVDLYKGASSEDKNINELFFSIRDTGIGINEEQQRRLFQKYTQASSEITRKYGGTGLGLTIASQLVTLLGGILGVNSKKGEGSTFYFGLRLPVGTVISKAKAVPAVTQSMIERLRGIRVLITDDNEYNRTVAREAIVQKIPEAKVDEAESGLQTLELLRKNKYDVILMDLVMARLDGVETSIKIRKELPAPACDTPIIVLTASVVKSEIERCREAGTNGFLAKPFKSDELLSILFRTLHNEEAETGVTHKREKVSDKGKEPSKLIDTAYFSGYMDNDQLRMKKHILRFKKQIPVSLRSLRSFVENGDYENARIVAHSMKPLLSVLGVDQGRMLAEKIELGCLDKKDKDELMNDFAGLEKICVSSLAEAEQINF